MPSSGWPHEVLKSKRRTDFRSHLHWVGLHHTGERPVDDAAANDGFNLRAAPVWFRGRFVFIEQF